jgi:hypothetical protein
VRGRVLGVVLLWELLARRRRRRREKSLRKEASYRQAAEISHVRAEAHLLSSLSDTDHMDVKALHLAVADIAVFAIVVTFQNGWLWLIPAVPLVLAAICFFLVFKPRYWLTGPDPARIHRVHRKKSPRLISQAIADELMEAVDINDKKLEMKADYLDRGHIFLGLGLAATFLMAIIDRATN